MKIIHMNGFTDDERLSYKSLIFNNTFHGMKTIVTAARDLGIEIKDEKNKVICFRLQISRFKLSRRPCNIEKKLVSYNMNIYIYIYNIYSQEIANKILTDEKYFAGEINPALAEEITSLWGDSGIKDTFARSAEYQLGDSAE